MSDQLAHHVDRFWQEDALPVLKDLVSIPCLSPAFDAHWQDNGFLLDAVHLVEYWSKTCGISDLTTYVASSGTRTPALVISVPGSRAGNILFYGHLDKQPASEGWDAGLGPWSPVIREGKLFGRGSADDGYAVCAALGAIAALRESNVDHPSCNILLECSEESGSTDLEFYCDHLEARLGVPDVVFVLDSQAGNYDQLWTTPSLRGTVNGTLSVKVLEYGIHSGRAGGVIPSSFRIARQLLDRIEDSRTGEVAGLLTVPIPEHRIAETRAAAGVLSDSFLDSFPLAAGTRPIADNVADLLVNNTWRPSVAVIGADGLPELDKASSTHLPATVLKLNVRIPPTLDAGEAAEKLKSELERHAPYDAGVTFSTDFAASGWNSARYPAWLGNSINNASLAYFGKPAQSLGTGGTIPLLALLASRFSDAALVVTGILGPHSNAHGPNEFLHLAAVQKLTACVAAMVKDAAEGMTQ